MACCGGALNEDMVVVVVEGNDEDSGSGDDHRRCIVTMIVDTRVMLSEAYCFSETYRISMSQNWQGARDR